MCQCSKLELYDAGEHKWTHIIWNWKQRLYATSVSTGFHWHCCFLFRCGFSLRQQPRNWQRLLQSLYWCVPLNMMTTVNKSIDFIKMKQKPEIDSRLQLYETVRNRQRNCFSHSVYTSVSDVHMSSGAMFVLL